MAKRNDLKRKLKASDRRRRQRSASTSPTMLAQSNDPSGAHGNEAGESNKVDVFELLSRAILQNRAVRRDACDAAVVSGMVGFQKGVRPTGDCSGVLFDSLAQIGANPEVSARSLRDAISQMLDAAKDCRDEKKPDAFLRYLALLAE